MTIASHAGLPDPDAARRTISETVPELGPGIAKQARSHAEAVRPFLERRRLRGSTREAADLISDIATGGGNSWESRVSLLLRGFIPIEDAYKTDLGGIGMALMPVKQALQWKPDRWLWKASDSELRPVLSELHKGLVTLADSLARSIQRPALLPAHHPPGCARLRDDVVAETVAEQLAMLIEAGVKQYDAAQEGGWPGSSREAALSWRFEDSLRPFLTTEVQQRYWQATWGFKHAEELVDAKRGVHRGRSPIYEEYREIAAGIHPRIHSAYVAIAVNYLAEVLELMPKYAEDSGQGKRRDPVTVYGNVGAIGDVHNSNVSVADTVLSIGTSINTVADRGDTDTAAAIRALAKAVQQDPGLAETLRAQLLDNLADVADAAVAPDEPRRLSRARAAMASITAAAGTSTQLAEAVGNWQHVLGQLF
ncbi:hypothetical protein ACH40F_55880 [Streptomyces sp. NPDC020794]|uniref:hypothetical protein n=1 Tax=unclassified Streptomyces TaxID=2593676 RepID=UPI0036EC4C0E